MIFRFLSKYLPRTKTNNRCPKCEGPLYSGSECYDCYQKQCDDADEEIAVYRENSELNEAGWEVFGDGMVWAWTPSLTLAHEIAEGSSVPKGSVVRAALTKLTKTDILSVLDDQNFLNALRQAFAEHKAGEGLVQRLEAAGCRPKVVVISPNEKIVRKDPPSVDGGAI
jgi:hypothetical protein